MNKRISSLFFVLLFILIGGLGFAQEHHEETESDAQAIEKKEGFSAVKMIMDHISDSNEWHIATLNEGEGENEKHISVPLPIIIKDNNGWHFFLSTAIEHGHEHEGYTLDKEGRLISTKNVEQASLFSLVSGKQDSQNVFYDFSVSKNVLALFLSCIFMLLVFVGMANGYKKSPMPRNVLARLLEPIVVFIRDEVAIPNIGTKKYKRYLPYLLTAFFFIWFNNLFGLIPFFPGGANLTGNIAVTGVLAIFTLIIILFSANRDYWKHIFLPPVPLWLYPIIVPIEIIGIFTKPFALMMRLFANVTAGHIMILAIIGLIFIFETAALGFASVPLALFVSVLELLVAVLQAYIFTMLSALFIGLAVQEHHHDEAEL
ncbi:F0F1 ATP synthase subunit A [Riemerella columbipharyngis]|uniref:ATP synthase subunit a n=1 Tax=Riemerella columbipharyngis TaxID=1071918 RepID=A0A1G7FA46_9FLAO|nr:F0F1 ATP synthase subunit A [Riemerella columbipharyngis]SDE72769.1 F-type H+-transporting ATPase subunit a [Riemerella columbipharyngis]